MIIQILWAMRPYSFFSPFMLGLTGAVIGAAGIERPGLALAAGLLPFIGMGLGDLVNDYYGVEEDKINHPYRALASGKVDRHVFLIIILAGTLISVGFSFYLDVYAGLIGIAAFLIAIVYPHLKRLDFLGHTSMAAVMALPILFGSLVASHRLNGVVLFAAAAVFLYHTGVNIIYAISDIHGDQAKGIHTLPVRIGAKRAAAVAGFLVLCGLGLYIAPWVIGLISWQYLVFFPVFLLIVVSGFATMIPNPTDERSYWGATILCSGYRLGFPALMAAFVSPLVVSALMLFAEAYVIVLTRLAHKRGQYAP